MRAIRMFAPKAPLEAADLADAPLGVSDVRISIEACGICHSDAHYRAGFGNVPLPRTPGHEIAGVVSEIGDQVRQVSVGDRVAVHYLLSCGQCRSCREAGEQFCETGRMIGKHADGGYAESIVVPATNAIPVPASVPLETAAIMMCSTATAYHALRVGDLQPGMSLAVLGFGGLGVSAVHLGLMLGAGPIAAVDVVPEKLAAARALGAVPIDGSSGRVTEEMLEVTNGYGFHIALDFTGRPEISIGALRALAPGGRLVLVALSEKTLPFDPYRDVLAKERHILGCSDHLREELFDLMRFAASGALDVSTAVSHRVPLDAAQINAVLDGLDTGGSSLRTVMTKPFA